MSAFGMFNALVLSYSRLPLAMARDGLLPRAFATVHPKTGVPWVSILACAVGWGLCLGLGFDRLVTLDIILYGSSLLLEFVALVALRLREPDLHRPFRVPGGLPGAILSGVFPALLLGLSIFSAEHEAILGINAAVFAAGVLVAGFAVYGAVALWRMPRQGMAESEQSSPKGAKEYSPGQKPWET